MTWPTPKLAEETRRPPSIRPLPPTRAPPRSELSVRRRRAAKTAADAAAAATTITTAATVYAHHTARTRTHTKCARKKKKIPAKRARRAPEIFVVVLRPDANKRRTSAALQPHIRYIDPYTCVGDTAFHPPLPPTLETRVSRRVPPTSSSSLATRLYCTSASRVPFVIR